MGKNIDNLLSAILARDSGVPYPEVIERYGVSPRQFYMAVKFELSDFIQSQNGEARQRLEDIEKDTKRKKELFNMGEEFVRRQYDRISGRIPNETQKRLHEGTFEHPENVEALIYYALTFNNPQLASTERKVVVQAIESLLANTNNLHHYFQSIGLGGVMQALFIKGGKISMPLAVLAFFDNAYKKRAKDVSLFSKAREPYIKVYQVQIT